MGMKQRKVIFNVLVLSLFILMSVYIAYSLSVGTNLLGGGQISFASASKSGAAATGNFTNISGVMVLNATVIYNATGTGPYGGITNLSFVFIHSDGTRSTFNLTNATVNGTVAESNANSNTTFWNISLDSTNLKDGNYTITVNASNFTGSTFTANDALGSGLGNRSANNLVFAITIDNTPPNVTAATFIFGNYSGYAGNDGRYVGINLSAGLSQGNYTLWAVVNDSTTYAQSVRFNLSNASGSVMPFNYTATRNDTNFTTGSTGAGNIDTRGPFNVSKLAEGWYNLTVWTNDSLGNVNNSVRIPFVLDRTAPSVTVTCTPSNPTEGQIVTCSCSFTDTYPGSGLVLATTGFGSGSDSESTTAAGSGSFTSSECRARDYAGNLATATGSWTVTAASSGGGGGGGSGGGSSSGVPTQFEKKVWTSINAGETATVPVKNGVIGVTEVSFSVAETTYGAWVQVKKLDSLPSSVDAFNNLAYRTLEITQQNVQKALQGSATVKFKVEKAWLSDNSVNAANVALFRFVDGDWTTLPTTQGEDDGTYVHYSATTSGFSYFVIGESETAVVEEAAEAAPVVEEAVEEVPAEEEAGAAEAAGEAMAKKSNAAVWIVPLVVLIVIAGLLYWYWQRR